MSGRWRVLLPLVASVNFGCFEVFCVMFFRQIELLHASCQSPPVLINMCLCPVGLATDRLLNTNLLSDLTHNVGQPALHLVCLCLDSFSPYQVSCNIRILSSFNFAGICTNPPRDLSRLTGDIFTMGLVGISSSTGLNPITPIGI